MEEWRKEEGGEEERGRGGEEERRMKEGRGEVRCSEAHPGARSRLELRHSPVPSRNVDSMILKFFELSFFSDRSDLNEEKVRPQRRENRRAANMRDTVVSDGFFQP